MSREAKGRRVLHYLIITSFVTTVVLAIALAGTGYTAGGEESVESDEKDSYVVYGVEIPGKVSFALFSAVILYSFI